MFIVIAIGTGTAIGTRVFSVYSSVCSQFRSGQGEDQDTAQGIDRDKGVHSDRDRDTIMLLSWSMSWAKFKIFEFRSGQRPGHALISGLYFIFKLSTCHTHQHSMNIFLSIHINIVWFCKFWPYEKRLEKICFFRWNLMENIDFFYFFWTEYSRLLIILIDKKLILCHKKWKFLHTFNKISNFYLFFETNSTGTLSISNYI